MEAELDFALQLGADIETGTLGGVDWWRSVHEPGADPVALPPSIEPISSTDHLLRAKRDEP
jgi:hypothetical protein